MSAVFRRDRVTIIGVLNATPDSFSDGGRFVHGEARVDVHGAVDAASALVREGAHVLDVGGESTRPGAALVSAPIEIQRTIGIIEALAKRFDVAISIDTRKASVAGAAVSAGASLINDVSGLRFDPDLSRVAAEQGAQLLLGHCRGTPETMQRDPHYDDVLTEVGDELGDSIERAVSAGVPRTDISLDPGIGFGKRPVDNWVLLANAGALGSRFGLPICVGPSRKSFLGALTGDAATEARDGATHAACAIAIFAGANAIRVHDVAGAVRAAAVASALRDARRDREGSA